MEGGEDRSLVTKQSTIAIYQMFLAQEKALYQNMNMLKSQSQRFTGFFWAPVESERDIINFICEGSGAEIEPYDDHNIGKPTFFKPNEFSYVFQEITDTYGTPNYQEANPALISIVTFPFLFGVMFGDFGHGLLVFMFGSVLCLFSNQLKDGPLGFLLPYRYFALLLGVFATYCGLLYNEFFALPMEIFKSCYSINDREMFDATLNEDG